MITDKSFISNDIRTKLPLSFNVRKGKRLFVKNFAIEIWVRPRVSGRRGDLYVRINSLIPTNKDDEELLAMHLATVRAGSNDSKEITHLEHEPIDHSLLRGFKFSLRINGDTLQAETDSDGEAVFADISLMNGKVTLSLV